MQSYVIIEEADIKDVSRLITNAAATYVSDNIDTFEELYFDLTIKVYFEGGALDQATMTTTIDMTMAQPNNMLEEYLELVYSMYDGEANIYLEYDYTI